MVIFFIAAKRSMIEKKVGAPVCRLLSTKDRSVCGAAAWGELRSYLLLHNKVLKP